MSSVRLKFPRLLQRLRCDNNNYRVMGMLRLCLFCDYRSRLCLFVGTMQDLFSAIESRGMKLGKAMYRELTGLRKPVLDKNNMLHWPVLLLYAEVMSSDFVEDFCETDMLSAHLDMISFF